MDAEVGLTRREGPGAAQSAASALLLCLMAVGSFALWIGVPAGCLWLSSKLANSLAGHFVIGLPMTVTAMIAWGWGLFWLNRLYLRVNGFFDEPEDPDEPPRPLRGPIEPILAVSFAIALISLFFWFFLLAENPSSQFL